MGYGFYEATKDRDFLKSEAYRVQQEVEQTRRRNSALLERVTVLERALEEFADPTSWPSVLREKPYVVAMRQAMRSALDG